MSRYYYMAVTPDKYELPLAVEEQLYLLAIKLGMTNAAVKSAIDHKRSGKLNKVKIVKIEQEEPIEVSKCSQKHTNLL